MKKVFIVSVSLCIKGGKREKVILNVFTSFHKAKVYADYKNLQIARKGVSIFQVPGACPVECAVVVLEQQSICSIDWSADLKKLQDANYNYVISPKDRARLERSIVSLDKRLPALWQKQCECYEVNCIAEEKRNFELTKKYNLLDFV